MVNLLCEYISRGEGLPYDSAANSIRNFLSYTFYLVPFISSTCIVQDRVLSRLSPSAFDFSPSAVECQRRITSLCAITTDVTGKQIDTSLFSSQLLRLFVKEF